MTPNKFRSLALNLPGAVESAHMGHPDFRVEGRIFATLGYPDDKSGMVKFTPDQQSKFLKEAPGVFAPCSGVWGQRGATNIHLPTAKVALLRTALKAAWNNATEMNQTRGATKR
jgi:hypothetical protein